MQGDMHVFKTIERSVEIIFFVLAVIFLHELYLTHCSTKILSGQNLQFAKLTHQSA